MGDAAVSIGLGDAAAQVTTAADALFVARQTYLTASGAEAGILGQAVTAVAALTKQADRLAGAMQSDMDGGIDGLNTGIDSARLLLLALAAVGLGFAELTGWFLVHRGITRRLAALAVTMDRVRLGQFDAPIPAGGQDEISAMATALTVFRDTAVRAAQQEAAANAEREQSAAERHATCRRSPAGSKPVCSRS